jgi:GMP synthase-like glutamine amidotransferase
MRMKPILIVQHIDDSGPGLFREFLELRQIGWRLRRPDLGDPLPSAGELADYSGLCLCGGTQSANDAQDWIGGELALIRAAARSSLPVIGHCLGGQLISKALGGTVTRHPGGEFGWSELEPAPADAGRYWLDGLPEKPVAMQWHNETFTVPAGAELLLTGKYCRNQAFAAGRMLALQFHVEATAETVRHWATGLAHLAPAPGPSVQPPAVVLAQIPEYAGRARALAMHLYERWLGTF